MSVPESERSYVEEALSLLKRLNQTTTASGERVSELVKVHGFEPWWFIQHQLLWTLLIPYCKHRAVIRRVLDGRPPSLSEMEEEALALCRSVGLPLSGSSARTGSQPPGKKILGRMSQLGLALFSLGSLLLFRLRRRDTLLYILDRITPGSDHDFRLAPVYRELRQRRYRFAEYLHHRGFDRGYLPTWSNILERRRPVVAFESLARVRKLFSRAGATGLPAPALDSDHPDRPFLELAIRWGLRQSRAEAGEVEVLRKLLRFQRVRRAVIVDHSTILGKLLAACRLEGIPTVGYMHGNFTRFHAGLMAYGFAGARRHTFDLYGLWSEPYRRRLLAGDLYREEELFVCGPLRPPEQAQLQAVADSRRWGGLPVRCLLISEAYAPQEEVMGYARRLMEDDRFRLMLKVRPGEATPHLTRAAVDGSLDSMEILREDTVYAAFERCDVVLGTHSTVLYEAVLAQRPVVVLATSFTYGDDLPREGLAELASSPTELLEVVMRAHELEPGELSRRRNLLWGETLTDGARRLLDEAERRLWPAPGLPGGAIEEEVELGRVGREDGR